MTTETTERTDEQIASDAQAAFAAGFADVRGDTPPAPAPAAEPTPAPAPAAEPAPEPAAPSAPPPASPPAAPDLESRIKQLESMLGDTAHRLRSAEGRVAALQREREKLSHSAPPPPSAAPAPAPDSEPDPMETLVSTYSEFGPAVKSAVESALKKVNASALSKDDLADATKTALAPIVEAIVDTRHKGWKNTVKTPEFKFWLAAAPEDVAALAGSDSPQDAIELLDKYMEARSTASPAPAPPPPPSPPAPPNRDKLRAAGAVGGGAKTTNEVGADEAFRMGFESVRRGRAT